MMITMMMMVHGDLDDDDHDVGDGNNSISHISHTSTISHAQLSPPLHSKTPLSVKTNKTPPPLPPANKQTTRTQEKPRTPAQQQQGGKMSVFPRRHRQVIKRSNALVRSAYRPSVYRDPSSPAMCLSLASHAGRSWGQRTMLGITGARHSGPRQEMSPLISCHFGGGQSIDKKNKKGRGRGSGAWRTRGRRVEASKRRTGNTIRRRRRRRR